MNITRFTLAALVLGTVHAGMAYAQEPAAPAVEPPTAAPQATNNLRRAIRWTQFVYTCEGGAKLTVYLGDQLAKVRYGEQAYLMKQTVSADGNRYSDGKVVWWGKGNGGFLQEDTADGNGKMIVQGCQLDKPLNADNGSVTGTVSYLQRIALPPSAVIQVRLQDISLADAPAKIIAEQTINLGQRQVPVPFTLNFDPGKIDAKHSYSVSAKITVDGKVWFTSDQAYPVLTGGKPSHVDMVLKQVVSVNMLP